MTPWNACSRLLAIRFLNKLPNELRRSKMISNALTLDRQELFERKAKALGRMTGGWIVPKKRKPHAERKPEDYRETADNALELAIILAGQGGISDQDFLERMARSDELVDHDGTKCGQCHHMILGAEIAREMIEAGEYEDVVSKWTAEHKRRWEKGKFFKLWEKEKKAGRDPRQAFKDRGWEP